MTPEFLFFTSHIETVINQYFFNSLIHFFVVVFPLLTPCPSGECSSSAVASVPEPDISSVPAALWAAPACLGAHTGCQTQVGPSPSHPTSKEPFLLHEWTFKEYLLWCCSFTGPDPQHLGFLSVLLNSFPLTLFNDPTQGRLSHRQTAEHAQGHSLHRQSVPQG